MLLNAAHIAFPPADAANCSSVAVSLYTSVVLIDLSALTARPVPLPHLVPGEKEQRDQDEEDEDDNDNDEDDDGDADPSLAGRARAYPPVLVNRSRDPNRPRFPPVAAGPAVQRLLAFNGAGDRLIAGGDDKFIYQFDCADLSERGHCFMLKKVCASAFDQRSGTLMAADKTGDIFAIDTQTMTKTLTLGHLSIVTGLALSPPAHLISCDSDGKVRVSRHPQHFDIVSFCLGHHAFVSACAVVPEPATGRPLIVSGGLGCELLLWAQATGQRLAAFELTGGKSQKESEQEQDKAENFISAIQYSSVHQLFAVVMFPLARVSLFRLVAGPSPAISQAGHVDLQQNSAIAAMAFDPAGRLWTLTTAGSLCVHSLAASGEWRAEGGPLGDLLKRVSDTMLAPAAALSLASAPKDGSNEATVSVVFARCREKAARLRVSVAKEAARRERLEMAEKEKEKKRQEHKRQKTSAAAAPTGQ